ncbi:MAG TPA: antitoxin [Pseudonocardiaceae bacterium]|nr:antitoxin [Pseudonocardiaceae bacterium]
MGIGDNMDKLRKMAGEHSEQVDKGVDKAAEFADEKTGQEHSEQIDKAREEVEQRLGQRDQQ